MFKSWWKDCVKIIASGQPYVATRQITITDTQLRELLASTKAPSIILDGGDAGNIKIVADPRATSADGRINVRYMTNATGGATPPLILRHCTIVGVLDIGGSHLGGLEIEDCWLRGLRGDGAQIENDVVLHGINFPAENALPKTPPDYCQIRLAATRIDGSFVLRKAKLRSPPPSTWDDIETIDGVASPTKPGEYANHFGLTLAGSEIGGRVLITHDVEVIGGISVYQAIVRSSLRMDAHRVAVHDTAENGGDAARNNFIAFNGNEVRIDGALSWGSARAWAPNQEDIIVCGRISLVGARIENDVTFESCTFAANTPLGSRVAELETDTHDDGKASGGIDMRRIRIGGQLRFHGRCRIGRRAVAMSARRKIDRVGPSLDAWKAHIGLGIIIEAEAEFYGPIHLNGCHFGREVSIYGRIRFSSADSAIGVYDTALTLSNTVLEGSLFLHIPSISGRVVLERLRIVGSAEVAALGFENLHAPVFVPDTPPFDESSIVDMQDMSVTGGINLKRDAFTIAVADPTPWKAGFVFDMRGMSCASWDDADATCWAGLNHAGLRNTFRSVPPSRSATPWRIKFEGMSFARLDSSAQGKIDAEITRARRGMGGWALPFFTGTFGSQSFFGRLAHIGWEGDRTHMTLSEREVLRFRLQALRSLHSNRWRPRTPRLIDFLTRWTFQRSWRRRELVPPFSPLPFDEFARGYRLNGYPKIASVITVRRMTLQWRKWFRRLCQFAAKWVLVPAVILSVALLATGWGVIALAPVPVAAAILMLAGLVIVVFRYGFGYGLFGANALVTAGLFVLLAMHIADTIVPRFGASRFADGAVATANHPFPHRPLEGPCRRVIDKRLAPKVFYGFDKLVPIDMGQDVEVIAKIDALNTNANAELRRQPLNTVRRTTMRALHECSRSGRQIFRIVDNILSLIGWLIVSLVVLTFSGVLRRDIERN